MSRNSPILTVLFAVITLAVGLPVRPAVAQEPTKGEKITIEGEVKMTAAYQGIGSGGVSLSTPQYVITDKSIGQMFELVLGKENTVQFGKRYKVTGIVGDHHGAPGYMQTYILQVQEVSPE